MRSGDGVTVIRPWCRRSDPQIFRACQSRKDGVSAVQSNVTRLSRPALVAPARMRTLKSVGLTVNRYVERDSWEAVTHRRSRRGNVGRTRGQGGSGRRPTKQILSAPGFRHQLSLCLKPVGAGITGKCKSVSPLGDEVGARPDFFLSRFAR
jgi:hypothetical protein